MELQVFGAMLLWGLGDTGQSEGHGPWGLWDWAVGLWYLCGWRAWGCGAQRL